MSENNTEHKLSLDDSSLSKRWPSWVLFVVTIALFLVVPLLSLSNSDFANLLRSSPLPSDNSWISGHLSQAHQIPDLNENCEACHVNAFEVVQDSTCIGCHADTNHHFDTSVHDVAKLEGERCASCHREHEEPSEIVRQDDQLCTSCHADMAETGAVTTNLRDVDSFGLEQKKTNLKNPHPSFRISMLTPSGVADATTWSTTRVDLSSNPVEKSNLIFPHDVHLNAQGIDSPSGQKVLACNDCHVTDDAGKLMQPVRMETHCRQCHTMVFDEQAPGREVPHGEPDTVILTLEEYYSRQYLMKELGREPTAKEVRDFMLRRPGRTVERRVKQTNTMASPWGKAQSVAQEIFERTTCKTCHEISIDESGKHLSKWRVNPIRLTEQWMPKSSFDHYSHKTFDCTSCHFATTSDTATDVLMPDLDNCESCHTGSRTHESKLPSTCVSCHNFHLPSQKTWSEIDQASLDEISEAHRKKST